MSTNELFAAAQGFLQRTTVPRIYVLASPSHTTPKLKKVTPHKNVGIRLHTTLKPPRSSSCDTIQKLFAVLSSRQGQRRNHQSTQRSWLSVSVNNLTFCAQNYLLKWCSAASANGKAGSKKRMYDIKLPSNTGSKIVMQQ